MRPRFVSLAVLLLTPLPLLAQGGHQATETPEEFMAKLAPRSGTVVVGDSLATLHVPEQFRFLGPEASRRLLVDGWGNPPKAVEGTLGIIYPADLNPLTEEGWAVVISFDDDGYVDDKGAESLDFDKLLKQMREGAADANKERKKEGYPAIHLLGWAEPPHYDQTTHKLYWAKELAVDGDSARTLNYNVRVLGRRGVLVLNAVAPMSELSGVRHSMRSVIGFVTFNPGHRYQDYVAGMDKKAKYGIAGLILGAVAVKAGFFKLIWVGILAFKKLILAGIAAAGVALRKIFKKKGAPAGAA